MSISTNFCLLKTQNFKGHGDHDHYSEDDHDYYDYAHGKFAFLHKLKEFWQHWLYDKKQETLSKYFSKLSLYNLLNLYFVIDVVGTIARGVSKSIVHHYAEDFKHHDHPVPGKYLPIVKKKTRNKNFGLTEGFIGKVMGGVHKAFKPKSKNYDSEKHYHHHHHHEAAPETDKVSKEHGNFDSYGRDAVRQIGGLASRTEKRIEKLVASTGLDVKEASAFGGAVEKFKDHVRAIYPG